LASWHAKRNEVRQSGSDIPNENVPRKKGLNQNDVVEMRIATVPVAAIGVSPMASTRRDATIRCNLCAFDLVGGTPTSAGETPAIPRTYCSSVSIFSILRHETF
jgi:hypothetical protein